MSEVVKIGTQDELEKKYGHEPSFAKANQDLDIVFASELSLEFEPPNEILEGVFAAGEGSVLYGASNSGKTFLAIDIAASISRGSNWLEGKRTESGLVIYLAAESPASVCRRIQAYQKFHKVRLFNFIVVKNPIDLFSQDGDTNKIIDLANKLEQQRDQKVKLIVGDTLARLSAGANENAGQDMSIVVQHFDNIRSKTGAHFNLVHHSGKNIAAGARGWSGIRAAIDTEIEITDSPDGRCIEITKQRDLDSNGTRIGFKLEPVILGKSKWGSPTGSCVVLSNEVPPKKSNVKLSALHGRIVEYVHNFLGANPGPLEKCQVPRHFGEEHHKGTIYKAIKKLVEVGELIENNGFIYIGAKGAK